MTQCWFSYWAGWQESLTHNSHGQMVHRATEATIGAARSTAQAGQVTSWVSGSAMQSRHTSPMRPIYGSFSMESSAHQKAMAPARQFHIAQLPKSARARSICPVPTSTEKEPLSPLNSIRTRSSPSKTGTAMSTASEPSGMTPRLGTVPTTSMAMSSFACPLRAAVVSTVPSS